MSNVQPVHGASRFGIVLGASLLAAMLSACAMMQPGASDARNATPAPAASAMPSASPPATPAATPTPPGAPSPPAAASPPAPGATPPAAGAPRPFAEVIKDAKQVPGFLPIWQKDDRTWIEIAPEMLDKPFFLSINMNRGIGERGLFAGLMGRAGTRLAANTSGSFARRPATFTCWRRTRRLSRARVRRKSARSRTASPTACSHQRRSRARRTRSASRS